MARDELRDIAVKQALYCHSNLRAKDIPVSFIGLKRVHLKVHRAIKEIQQ